MTKATRIGVYGWGNPQGSNLSGAENVVEWKCKGGHECRAEREGGTWKLVRGPVGVRGSTARNLSVLRKAADKAGRGGGGR